MTDSYCVLTLHQCTHKIIEYMLCVEKFLNKRVLVSLEATRFGWHQGGAAPFCRASG